MKEIELTRGHRALVDDDDYERVVPFRWQAELIHGNWRAKRIIGTGKDRVCIYMHRFILNAPSGVSVDHKDSDGLNNQKSNLRLATPAQNSYNQRPHRQSPHGFKGVTKARSLRWRSQIAVSGKNYSLGTFTTLEEAARAYDAAAKKYFGEFARLNFSNAEWQAEKGFPYGRGR